MHLPLNRAPSAAYGHVWCDDYVFLFSAFLRRDDRWLRVVWRHRWVHLEQRHSAVVSRGRPRAGPPADLLRVASFAYGDCRPSSWRNANPD